MPAITDDTIEAILDELDLKALTPQPQPERPLQNASEESGPAISVIVAATTCSRELLRTLQLITQANQRLVERFGKKAEIIVAVYGTEQTDSALLGNFACAEEFDARIVLKNIPNYAVAVNAAAGVARAEILVLLKSDLMPKRDCLCHILEAIADKKSLGGGTSVASEDKSVSSRLASVFMQLPLKLSGVSLGVMFVRKSVFRKLEGFRETLFSGETIEFALRLKKYAVTTGGQFSNVRAVCATRYGKGALRLSLKEWFMLLVLPLVLDHLA